MPKLPSTVTDTRTALAWVETAKQAIAAATDFPMIKKIRDRAELLRGYCCQAGESLEIQNAMAAIKLRAERRAGELLLATEKNAGGRNRSHRATGFPTLAELGINKTQSSRWQMQASLPEGLFEQHLAEFASDGKELTSRGILELVRHYRKERRRQE